MSVLVSAVASCAARLTLVSLLGLVSTGIAFYCMVQWKRVLRAWGADVAAHYRARRHSGPAAHRIDDGAEP